jgi:hypothetical protein
MNRVQAAQIAQQLIWQSAHADWPEMTSQEFMAVCLDVVGEMAPDETETIEGMARRVYARLSEARGAPVGARREASGD